MSIIRTLVALLTTLPLLTGCNSGSSENSTVQILIDVSANTGLFFEITGQGSYEIGEIVTLSAPTSFGGATFVHWSENGAIVSTDAQYSFTASHIRTLVPIYNHPPLISANVQEFALRGESVVLDASLSADPDGDPLTFHWAFDFAPLGITSEISEPESDVTTFAPELYGSYAIDLTISDGIHTVTETVFLSVDPIGKTTVNGIINEDSTWTVDGSPYEVLDVIQIADGVTLTIEPGVEIIRCTTCISGNESIQVFGGLIAIGAPDNPLEFHSVSVEAIGAGDDVRIEHARIHFGGLFVSSVTDSVLYGSPILPRRCNPQCLYERNIILNTNVEFFLTPNDADIVIANNLFVDDFRGFNTASAYVIDRPPSNALIRRNSFLTSERLATVLVGSTDIDLTLNYWGTADAEVISSVIRDRNTDLNILGYGIFDPYLMGPDTATPDLPSFAQ